jgi:two-component system response regulator PilR (NtrC family)
MEETTCRSLGEVLRDEMVMRDRIAAVLREGPKTIPEIAEAILERLARRTGTAAPRIAEDAIRALQAYAFPGNVRELENVLERALTLSTGGEITAEHVRLRSAARPTGTEAATGGAATAPAAVEAGAALGTHLESIERDAIIKALEKTRYNKTAAAKLLGMSFRALRYRIKKLGIE